MEILFRGNWVALNDLITALEEFDDKVGKLEDQKQSLEKEIEDLKEKISELEYENQKLKNDLEDDK